MSDGTRSWPGLRADLLCLGDSFIGCRVRVTSDETMMYE